MTRKEFRQVIKTELKSWAKEIHELKASRKEGKRGDRTLYQIEGMIFRLKYKFRYQHIAYCMFFNHRTMEQIESTESIRYEKPNMNPIEKMLEVWEGEIDGEVICDSAA